MEIKDIIKQIEELKQEFGKDLPGVSSADELQEIKVKYLGRKSKIAVIFSQMSSIGPKNRQEAGRVINSLKTFINEKISKINFSCGKNEKVLDLTFPSARLREGSCHILSSVTKEICSVFERIGFSVIEGKEIDDEWHNFQALNIPLEHPSRDAFDTFYLDLPQSPGGGILLRSHTSPSQVHIMRGNNPPLAVVSPGRVYRPDAVDATHSFMFHQIEGFAIDENISFANLKGVLDYFAREFFSPDTTLRLRPHFFPFTEPSAEVDVSCFACSSKKRQRSGHKKEGKCSVCKDKGWIEILGCGMIHPAVLRACKIDDKKYKGLAFGMGVERIAMLKYGIRDIRLFYENDIRFLEQFPL